MYQVSERFLNAMNSFIVQPVIRGTVGDIPFSNDDILADSFRCVNQCVTVNDVKVGGVFVGELNMTILKSVAKTRGDWYGKKVRCEYGLVINGEPEFIPCPSYEYTINEATWTEQGLKIVAYDNMLLLDKAYAAEQSSGFAWNWLLYISRKTGIALGNTQEEIEAMPNGNKVLGLYSTDNIETYRDCLSFLVSALCGFATIDRRGQLVIRQFNSNVVATIDAESRFAGCSFSDYSTRYTGLSAVDEETKEVKYIHVNPDDGLTMKLGNNPFLQYGTEEEKDSIRWNILGGIQAFNYVPFKSTLLGCCAYDLGDCIRFTEGIAVNSVGCIMTYDFGLNDYAIAGFGENPALESVQSKSDKNIAGLIKQQQSETLAVTALTNVSTVGIDADWKKLGDIAFYVSENQTVLFHAVVKHLLETGGTVRYRYILNDEQFDFIHEVQSPEGIDTDTLFIPINVLANVMNSFSVYVQSDDAIGEVEAINMRGAILGAGIVGADWDGTINITETFNLTLVRQNIFEYSDDEEITIATQTPIGDSVSDVYGLILERGLDFNFEDSLRITTQTPEYELATELGESLFLENGDFIVTEK